MRQLIGVSTPRGMQGRLRAVLSTLLTLIRMVWELLTGHWCPDRGPSLARALLTPRDAAAHIHVREMAFTMAAVHLSHLTHMTHSSYCDLPLAVIGHTTSTLSLRMP